MIRDLQLEAKAHIAVQQWIDTGALSGGRAITAEGICEIHRRFCELLPEDLLWVEDAATPSPAVFSRRSSTEVNCHVGTSTSSLAPANARPAALSRRCYSRACSCP